MGPVKVNVNSIVFVGWSTELLIVRLSWGVDQVWQSPEVYTDESSLFYAKDLLVGFVAYGLILVQNCSFTRYFPGFGVNFSLKVKLSTKKTGTMSKSVAVFIDVFVQLNDKKSFQLKPTHFMGSSNVYVNSMDSPALRSWFVMVKLTQCKAHNLQTLFGSWEKYPVGQITSHWFWLSTL
jgi:hypothetical protein